ncbi:MAG: hypothetical protein H6760_01435 [Candidatus Nomurabacteria bacterium]|nr:MAG: hypothetical protein H6760_01435 [Candidatus Nomurabacteria bacterium]
MSFLKIFSDDSKDKPKENDSRKPECPYCQGVLVKIPARKTKCFHCGKYIFVRTQTKDRKLVLVTEENSAAIDSEWESKQAATITSLVEKVDFTKKKEGLREGFGDKEPSVSDIKWGLWNKRLQEAMKRNDFSELSGIYFQMALRLHESGKDSFKLQGQAQKMFLFKEKQSGVVSSVEVFSRDGCEECKKINGKKFVIFEALKLMPLPVQSCTNKLNKNAPNGWCRCTFLPFID